MIGPLPRLRIYTDISQYLAVLGATLSGRITKGDAVATLERSMSQRLGVAHAVTMPMARTGIYLALKGLIRPGQKLILSPYTIADVVNMVVCAGGIEGIGLNDNRIIETHLYKDLDRTNPRIEVSLSLAAHSPAKD